MKNEKVPTYRLPELRLIPRWASIEVKYEIQEQVMAEDTNVDTAADANAGANGGQGDTGGTGSADTSVPVVPGQQPLPPSQIPLTASSQMPSTPTLSYGGQSGQGQVPTPGNPGMVPQPPSISDLHTSLYRNIFEGIVGGSKYDPQTGEMVHPRLSVKGVGAGLLAGALSGMLAGMATESKPGPAGTLDLSGAARAGQEAAQKQMTRNQAQQDAFNAQSDAEKKRQYSNFKMNLDIYKGGLEASEMQGKVLDGKIATESSIYADAITAGMPAMEGGTDLTGPQVMDLLKKEGAAGIQVHQDSVLMTGSKPIIDPKTGQAMLIPGTQEAMREPTYSVVDPDAVSQVTAKMQKLFPNQLGSVSEGQPIPLRVLIQMAQTQHQGVAADATLRDMVNRHNAEVDKGTAGFTTKIDPDDVTSAKLMASDPSFKNLIPFIPTHYGQNPDEMFKALEAKGQSTAGLAGLIPNGTRPWEDLTAARKKEADPDKAMMPAANVARLQQAISGSNLSRDVKDGLLSRFTPNMTVGDFNKLGAQFDSASGARQTADQSAADREQRRQDALAGRAVGKEDIDILSDQLLEPNNLTAMKDIGGRGTQRAQILAEAARKAKARGIPFDIGLINQRVKFLGEYEDPKARAAINRGAINNILQHGAQLADVNQANRRSNVKILNTPLNLIKDQFGDQTYTQYKTVSGVLKDELSLYFAGGYAPNKDQQEMWNKIQNDKATPAQTEAFAKEVVRLGLNRADTFNQQFKTNMGYDDPNIITPAAKEAAEHLGLGSEVSKFGSGGQLGQRAATQFTKYSSDGKWGWNGKAWVPRNQ